MADNQIPPSETNTQDLSDDPPLNDDWDDDFGGFEGASAVLDEASASLEASPSPWATFSMTAAPPDLVQSRPSNPPVQKPSPATPLDDPVPSRGATPNRVKSTDDLPESERGQQEVNRRSNGLDGIDVSLDDDDENVDDSPLDMDGPRQELSPAESESAQSMRPGNPPLHEGPRAQALTEQGNLRQLEDRLSVSEMERQNLIKQKEELADQLRALQKKHDETKGAAVTQDGLYYEMNERHEKELVEVREAGHQTLAIMIEEYKELTKKTMLEQQEICERRLSDGMREEMERCEGLLKKQEEMFNGLIEEERRRGEERIKAALSRYQEMQREKLTAALEEERTRSQELLETQAKSFEEQQAEAISKAVQSEREAGQRLIAEQEALTKTALEKERGECLELVQQSIDEERSKSKDLVKAALVEATEQQREAMKEANELAKQEMVRFSKEQRKMDDSKRRRSLAVMDLFVKGVQEQLIELMSPDNNTVEEEGEEESNS